MWEISHGKLPAALIELLPSLQQPVPFAVPPVVSSVRIPDRTNASPTFHYDSLVTINGDVNDTDHFIKQMAKVADQQITKSWKKFNDEFKY